MPSTNKMTIKKKTKRSARGNSLTSYLKWIEERLTWAGITSCNRPRVAVWTASLGKFLTCTTSLNRSRKLLFVLFNNRYSDKQNCPPPKLPEVQKD